MFPLGLEQSLRQKIQRNSPLGVSSPIAVTARSVVYASSGDTFRRTIRQIGPTSGAQL